MLIDLRFETIETTTEDKIMLEPRPCYTSGSLTVYIEDKVREYTNDIGFKGLISWRGEGAKRWKLLLPKGLFGDGGGV